MPYRDPEKRHANNLRNQRKYARSEAGMAVHRAAELRYRQGHPEKTNAHEAMRKAVRAGLVERGSCHCGETKTEAHHHLGYAVEHQLVVVWLCANHHREAHRAIPNASRDLASRGAS